MTQVWILGNFFQNWKDLDKHYQYFMLRQEFEKNGCSVKFINTPDLIIRNNSKYIEYQNELLEAPDIAVIKTFMTGIYWKEKMRKLQSLGTFILNDPENMIEYSDKIKMYKRLNDVGVPIPKTMGIDCNSSFDDILSVAEKIGWPCIIKPNYGWSTAGVFPCRHSNDLKNALANMQISLDDRMGKNRPKPTSYVIQELIDAKYMIVIVNAGKEKLHSTLLYGRHSYLQDTTYKNSPLFNIFNKHRMILEYQLPSEAKDIFLKALDALGLDFVRGEMFATENGYKICELNGSGAYGTTSITCRENIAKNIVAHIMNRYNTR
jgi:predicted ATP-grasp superfamily ATP-dependent carboligase